MMLSQRKILDAQAGGEEGMMWLCAAIGAWLTWNILDDLPILYGRSHLEVDAVSKLQQSRSQLPFFGVVAGGREVSRYFGTRRAVWTLRVDY